ncbi:MAG TPA: metal ABC transporter substrate-binding protein [Marmoricola sp.]|jgi:zinc transport system substrate-binding protein|nr:metal ABC transporter substrate-binding protein [Marmoricola sp.]
MQMRLALPLVALALAAPLSGCGAGSGDDGRPTVVASFYPLEFVTRQLAGDHVRVVDLTAPGVEPHDLELKPKQVGEVADADLVVYESKLQPAVDDAVEQNAKGSSLDVAPHVDIEGGNPHFWLDPLRLAKAATVIEEMLANVDPAHADAYAQNLTALRSTLASIDDDFKAGLQHCERSVIVTSHDAFGYWSRYGLTSEPIAGLSPDAEPSAQHLDELRALVEKDHVTTVFSETLASPKMADVLSHDLGIATAVLDPIEGVRKGSSADYVSIMHANLTALQKANGCKVSP